MDELDKFHFKMFSNIFQWFVLGKHSFSFLGIEPYDNAMHDILAVSVVDHNEYMRILSTNADVILGLDKTVLDGTSDEHLEVRQRFSSLISKLKAGLLVAVAHNLQEDFIQLPAYWWSRPGVFIDIRNSDLIERPSRVGRASVKYRGLEIRPANWRKLLELEKINDQSGADQKSHIQQAIAKPKDEPTKELKRQFELDGIEESWHLPGAPTQQHTAYARKTCARVFGFDLEKVPNDMKKKIETYRVSLRKLLKQKE